MTKSRLAAFAGALLFLAGALLAQDFGSAPTAMGGNGRAHVYSQGEIVGFVMIAVALALFAAAWRMSGRRHVSKW